MSSKIQVLTYPKHFLSIERQAFMKKCRICTFGSWVSGLSAVVLGVLGPAGFRPRSSPLMRGALALIAFTGLGFLIYQPPFKPCPRCERLTRANLQGEG